MIHILMKKILSEVLSLAPQTESTTWKLTVDDFLVLSKGLIASADDFVSVLDTPQDKNDIVSALDTLSNEVSALQTFLFANGLASDGPKPNTKSDDLVERTAALSIDAREQPSKMTRTRQQFDICFSRIYAWKKDLEKHAQ